MSIWGNGFSIGEIGKPLNLPNGYQNVPVLISNGAQYIDTGVYPNAGYSIEAKVRMWKDSSYATLWGTVNGQKARNLVRFNATSGGSLAFHYSPAPDVNYSTASGSLTIGQAQKDFHVYALKKNVASLDGIQVGNLPEPQSWEQFPNSIYLFALHGGSDADYSYAEFLYCRIWDESGNLVRSFVPALDPNETAGMYDLVHDVFYGSETESGFSYVPWPDYAWYYPGEIVQKTITENGTYHADQDDAIGYDPVIVNVPVPSGSLTITENGTYDVTDKAEAVVSVSGGTPVEPPLPAEYQEVEYMDFTPHCGYEVTIPQTFSVEAKISPYNIGSGSNNQKTAFGYRVSSQSNTDFELRVLNGIAEYWTRPGVDSSLSQSVSVGETVIVRGMAYAYKTTAFIGRYASYSSSTYHGFDGKIYYVKGWDVEGNLSFKFVPCYRKADNTPGFYDVVADVFYSTLNTTGGGSIALGPDAN